jgi:hypothetical protein
VLGREKAVSHQMNSITRRLHWFLVPIVGAVVAAGCSSPPEPAPVSPSTPAPVAVAPTPAPRAQSADQDWNIFPDPTTGTVDIYHKGQYVGEITGNEPAEQDPPVPH